MKLAVDFVRALSKNQLDCKLYLPSARHCAENTAGIASWDSTPGSVSRWIAACGSAEKNRVPVPSGAIRSLRIVRNVEIGVIEDVKEFRAKFEARALADFRLLDERKI